MGLIGRFGALSSPLTSAPIFRQRPGTYASKRENFLRHASWGSNRQKGELLPKTRGLPTDELRRVDTFPTIPRPKGKGVVAIGSLLGKSSPRARPSFFSIAALAVLVVLFSVAHGRLAEAKLDFDLFGRRYDIYQAARSLVDRVKKHDEEGTACRGLARLGTLDRRGRAFSSTRPSTGFSQRDLVHRFGSDYVKAPSPLASEWRIGRGAGGSRWARSSPSTTQDCPSSIANWRQSLSGRWRSPTWRERGPIDVDIEHPPHQPRLAPKFTLRGSATASPAIRASHP